MSDKSRPGLYLITRDRKNAESGVHTEVGTGHLQGVPQRASHNCPIASTRVSPSW